MSVAKVVEITYSRSKSFQDAIDSGIERASETIKNIRGAWVQEQKVVVDGRNVTSYRVNMTLSVLLED